ncbi:prolyl-tRNA synthetase associated domain-containing protein [Methylobacterium sp. WSM2598]|uniref:prolyl-tRNA synthetase associated domain-containing protein n=1 Tax=Methylobacterium sp. WSM2598 TaxID=398261 RepID=UPI000370E086|nr:prolyl-tRNA synthetase associated domain-containing protein [Methylobacterium sp. WSM2598]
MTAAGPDDLFAYLADLGIPVRTVAHRPVHTVAESRDLKAGMPGGHSKNLFLKDKRGRLFLVVAQAEAAIDLKRLHGVIGATGRLSFGSAELLEAVLGVKPGSVTPFGVINDRAGAVSVVLDAALMARDPVNVHPLHNAATTAITPGDLIRFLEATGHPPRVMALPAPEGDPL